MSKKRVIAFTMHEDDVLVARRVMPDGLETEGFVFGEMDENEIERLRERGIVVQELDTARREPPRVPFRGGFAAPEVVGPSSEPRTVHRLLLPGPLLPAWRQELERLGVEILEALQGFALRVRIPLPNVAAVNQLSFLNGPAEPLAATPAMLPRFGPQAGLLPPRDPLVEPFDVLLHNDAAREPFLAWLRDKQVTVGAARGAKVRLYLAAGSPMIDQIRAMVDWVDRLEVFSPPTLHNDIARVAIGLDTGHNPGAPFSFEGEGEIVGVADTGIDESHPDFVGRIVQAVPLGRAGDVSDPHGHGTHVAGSVLGDGAASSGRIRGTAPRARLFFQSLLDQDGGLGGLPFLLSDLFEEAYQAGARIHNNSWGAATSSAYRITSGEVDEFVHRRKDMLIVISAGNDGSAADPVIGQRNAANGFVDWLSIGSPATSKNALTVGASRSGRTAGGFSALSYGALWPEQFPAAPMSNELVSADARAIGGFSSRGPCDDYRIKPDLVAPGTDIVSCRSSRAPLRNFWGPDTINPRYAFMGGTSMAAPLVSGCAALVREYYLKQRQHQPSAALVKATLINGTRWLDGADAVADYPNLPNYHQGFGIVHMPSTIPTPLNPGLQLEFFDNWNNPATHFNMTGRRLRLRLGVASRPLRFCLVYSDAPGRGIQNNLDLLLEVPGEPRKRFGNEKVPRGFNGPDPNNNVEVIRFENAPAGDYLIQVTATNILKPPQDFALVITGGFTSPLVAM